MTPSEVSRLSFDDKVQILVKAEQNYNDKIRNDQFDNSGYGKNWASYLWEVSTSDTERNALSEAYRITIDPNRIVCWYDFKDKETQSLFLNFVERNNLAIRERGTRK